MNPTSLSFPADLHSLCESLWRELSRAVADKHHAWRTPVLGTVGTASEVAAPEARTVVLREVKAEARQLFIYTDTRSPKVAQVAANPNVTLLFWSPQKHWQLRVTAHMTLLQDPAAVAQRWQRVSNSPAAGDYLSTLAPGQAIDATPPAPQVTMSPAAPAGAVPAQHSQAPHFSVLVATATHFDWLELARGGHRRAGFDLVNGTSNWLVP